MVKRKVVGSDPLFLERARPRCFRKQSTYADQKAARELCKKLNKERQNRPLKSLLLSADLASKVKGIGGIDTLGQLRQLLINRDERLDAADHDEIRSFL